MVLISFFKEIISFLWEVSAFASRRENNHSIRIPQRMGFLVPHYHELHHILDHVWDMWTCSKCSTGSRIPKFLETPTTCSQSRKQRFTWAEKDGELQRNQEMQQISLTVAVSVASSSARSQILQTCVLCIVFNTFMFGQGQWNSYLTILKGLCTYT